MANKQEEIFYILQDIRLGNLSEYEATLKLQELGVVIKVDRELPPIAFTTDSFPVPCNKICHKIEQENMLKAGYVAIEPLIGDYLLDADFGCGRIVE